MALLPVSLPRRLFARTRVERVIAVIRVAIAASSLFAVWMDPAEPARLVEFTYTLHAAYLGYAVLLAFVMWRRDPFGHAPLVTHVGDILIVSVLQYLTLGPSSPFFSYFVYALFSAALRWGWRATVRTAVFVLLMYIVVGAALSRTLGPSEFELDRFVVRATYLLVVAVALVYLGQHEAWLREEIQQLANWPVPRSGDWDEGVPKLLEHAALIAGAQRAVLVWNINEEPAYHLAAWPGSASIKFPPGAIDPVVSSGLVDVSFVGVGELKNESAITVNDGGALATWRGRVVHPALLSHISGRGLASAPFKTGQLTGRVFFTNLPIAPEELIPLVEVLAREIGTSLDHLHSHERSREFAVAEERIRVARNLHDGVLQALTGIRLELQRMAGQERQAPSPPPVGDRLLAIERALSLEQRELRFFIEDLKPALRSTVPSTAVTAHLDELRDRLILEWRTPITIRVSPPDLSVPAPHQAAIPMIVHEAVVNALKHGKPTRVAVDVRLTDSTLRIVVSDDGQGFPFTGRRSHHALVNENAGPVSLRERAISLGGQIAVDSSSSGSSVELSIPVGADSGD